jgi:PAS domain S-box-containing protein
MFWGSKVRMRTVGLMTVAALAITVALYYFAIRTPPIAQRTLRIGFESVPPVQIRTDSGYRGVAVDTVNEAARRAGISLQWVETGTSSDEAFRRGLVDLWPIMADLPYRRKLVHITRPWLSTSHSLLIPVGSPSPDRGFSGRIALYKMPVHVRLLQETFPKVQLVQYSDIEDVVKAVCRKEVSAGFLEDRAALAALRALPSECSSTALRAEAVRELTFQLGIGSTFEAAGAADKIRGEIANLFRDGTMAATMAKYSYYGLDNSWSTYEMMEAAERARWAAWGIGALGIALAVTVWQAASLRQRKRSERELRASEERFRAMFYQAAVGAAQATPDGEVTLVNDRYCELLGYTREGLLRKGLLDNVHSDDRASVLAERERLLKGETPTYAKDIRVIHKDGEITWVGWHESLTHVGGSGTICTIVLVEDITERRQRETALLEREKRYRNMTDAGAAMIWVSGPDKLCTFFSQGWLNFTGSTMDQAIGSGWSAMIHPDDRARCYENYSSAFDGRRSFQTECRLRRVDGEYRWVLAAGVPHFEPGGAFSGYVGTCTDITEVKVAQQELLARQKLNGLGVLAGGIAHDFNNLLGSILATSELVLSELPEHSPAYGKVETITRIADRAAGIVNQMMAYAGQENPVFEPLDLAGLVNEMLSFLKVSISKKAVLTVDLPENLPAVRGHAAQIRQVVMNLITNASEALGGHEGGISVTLTNERSCPYPRAESTPALLLNEHLRLSVRDTGCGMTEEIQSRIFDPFFTTKFTGRGLGLAAVQGIVRDHGGIIKVVSAPGQGTRFDVVLPCTDQPAAVRADHGTPVPATAVASEGIVGTVLLVEDEDELRTAVARMLRKQNFDVREAADGHNAVELFRANPRGIDVVLLDLTLPGMNGRDVLQELRRMKPDVVVAITTAYSKATAFTGIDGQEPWLYIRKPYRLSGLTGLLRNACVYARSGGGRKSQSSTALIGK